MIMILFVDEISLYFTRSSGKLQQTSYCSCARPAQSGPMRLLD